MGLNSGKKTEKKFASLFKNPIFASKEEDINEHWDVKIDGVKYDVKGIKHIKRQDIFPNQNYHIIEIKNVNGDLGWLYGKADYFVFETFKYWIIISKDKLQNFIKETIKKEYVTSADKSLYCLYKRTNRKDVITMVSSIDLAFLSDKMIPKEMEHFKIGESIINNIREKDKFNIIGFKK